jgi:hypothetical protein
MQASFSNPDLELTRRQKPLQSHERRLPRRRVPLRADGVAYGTAPEGVFGT